MNPHKMSSKEVKRRWGNTQLSDNALEIAKSVLVEQLTYDEAAEKFKITKQYVGKIVRRIVSED